MSKTEVRSSGRICGGQKFANVPYEFPWPLEVFTDTRPGGFSIGRELQKQQHLQKNMRRVFHHPDIASRH